jgi:hypothetical protein
MNWIKANKFLAGFFAVMLVGIGVLGYFLFSASSEFDAADDNYHEKATELNRLRHLPLFPNAKNLKALEAQKDEAAQLVAAFQAQLTTREFPADDITPQEFQDRLKKAVTDIVASAGEAHLELPKEKFYLGFDPYETRPPEVEAVGPLTKQLKTIQWVMQKLIEKKITKLVSLKRYPLPEEKSLSSANNRRPERQERQDRQDRGSKELVSKYPFDLDLVARQKSLSDALDAIVGVSGPPFIIPRVVRFTNQKTKGPERAGAPGSPTTAPGQPPALLGYIVGEELVDAGLRLEMVEFAAPKDKDKEGAAAKPKASK